jgi:hypothetical protein
MIEERKLMNHYRSNSVDSSHQRSRTSSSHNDDADADDEDFNESNSNLIRTSKRRIRKKKKQENKNELNHDDYLACSFKTVIHRPTPHFYLAPTDNLPQQAQSSTLTLTPSPIIPAPALPLLVLPPVVNLPIHHRAHTETDLVFYNQQAQPFFYPANWYPPLPPGFIYGPPSAPPPPPPFFIHPERVC